MSKIKFALAAVAFFVLTLTFASQAQAQATRTWVSGVGDDVNPCSRTAPCKTFAGAISKTAAGGEISVLDPGGYGTVTITKSITIDGGSGAGWASILAAGTNGIIINHGAGGVVTLRNLHLNGASTGVAGIRILSGSVVHIENCTITGFRSATGTSAGRGISDERTAGGQLFVTDTVVRHNTQSGIVILPSSGSEAITAAIRNVTLHGNGNVGLAASNGSRVTISNSVISGNTSGGLYAESALGTSELNVESCVTSGNGTGVTAITGSTVRISNVHITNNGTGLLLAGGSILSYGNNRNSGNTTNGSPTGLVPGGVQ